VTAAGCLLASIGFLAGAFPLTSGAAALAGVREVRLATVCALVAAGSAAALTAALRRVTPPGLAGAICGAVLLLAGALSGYLADGAIELHAIDAARHAASASAQPGAVVSIALLIAVTQWFLIAAMIVAIIALATGLRLLTSGFPGK